MARVPGSGFTLDSFHGGAVIVYISSSLQPVPILKRFWRRLVSGSEMRVSSPRIAWTHILRAGFEFVKIKKVKGPALRGRSGDASGIPRRFFLEDQTVIDEIDKKVIRLIQGDLPLLERPFAELAGQAGIPEGLFLERVRSLQDRGVIRRFGATLRHQVAGFRSNAMVVWLVPEDRIEEAGRAMSGFREVTHCYQRSPQPDWNFNLYTMIHGNSRDDCRRTAEKISRETGIEEYELLFSEREFKKTSMTYF